MIRRFFVLLFVVMLACGGSDDGGGSATGPAIPFAQRKAVVDRVIANVDASDLTPENFAERAPAVADFMRTLPEFKSVRIESEVDQYIVGEYTDGEVFFVLGNRRPDPEAATTMRKLAPQSLPRLPIADGFPDPPAALTVNTFIAKYKVANDGVSAQLLKAGYTKATNTKTKGEFLGYVDDFDAFPEVGVFYVDGHGLAWRPDNMRGPADTYDIYLCTRSGNSEENDAKYASFRKSRQLIIGYEPKTQQPMYCMSHEYLASRVHFAKNSFVFLNVCSNAANGKMALAFQAAGAGAIFAWNAPVEDQDAYYTGVFMFDRLLGIKDLYPTSHLAGEAVRPYTIDEVYELLAHSPRLNRPGTDLKLVDTIQGRNHRLLLARKPGTWPQGVLPAINSASLNNGATTFVLNGFFGSTKGKVIADPNGAKTELEVTSWGLENVQTKVAPGVTKLQVVVAGGLKSNIADVSTAAFTLQGDETVGGKQFRASTTVLVKVDGVLKQAGLGNNIDPISFPATSGQTITIEFFSADDRGNHTAVVLKNPAGAIVATLPMKVFISPNGMPVNTFDTLTYVVP